jgi:lipoprotein-anchoring transpeptidase ErfK/SrfK
MTNKTLSRRNFIKLAALSLGSLAFKPLITADGQPYQHRLMRVSKISKRGEVTSVSIHKMPDEDSAILYQRFKDDLINVYYEVESEYGPEYNPIWYRVWGGYVHRASLQEVQYVLNPVTDTIKENFQLGEITVPYTWSMRYSSFYGWERAYRLYYQTAHWIVGIITGPDGKPWYQLEDELLRPLQYAIPAEHMRIVKDSEFDPISPDVPIGEKRIEISISRQELTAFEGDEVVLRTNVATGALTPEKQTPTGEFRIQSTYPSKHMGDGKVTDNIYAYELVGVPWSSFFATGIATHGTFWHTDFGAPQSSGCVNMRNHEAKWLFRWVNPVGGPHDRYRTGFGTRVSVV